MILVICTLTPLNSIVLPTFANDPAMNCWMSHPSVAVPSRMPLSVPAVISNSTVIGLGLKKPHLPEEAGPLVKLLDEFFVLYLFEWRFVEHITEFSVS